MLSKRQHVIPVLSPYFASQETHRFIFSVAISVVYPTAVILKHINGEHLNSISLLNSLAATCLTEDKGPIVTWPRYLVSGTVPASMLMERITNYDYPFQLFSPSRLKFACADGNFACLLKESDLCNDYRVSFN